MRRFVVAAAVVALLLVPSSVMGSHNMGHRYLVHGRILNADGMPMQQRDVEVRLMDGTNLRSSLFATTDCHGDFDSWKGRVDVRQGANVPHGGGEIEGPAAIPGSQDQYINIHFHDQFLSNKLKIEFKAGNETWTEAFDSAKRQTLARHQLATSFPPSAGCGNNYDEFNRTLTARVYISTITEQNTGEVEVRPRNVNTSFGPDAESGGTHAITSSFIGHLENGTIAAGQTVTIVGTDIGTKNIKLSDNDVKFHRVDSLNVIGVSAGGVLADFKYIGIGVIVIAILIGLYMGGNRLRDKMAEKRLRETSTRRRFRKENP